MLFFILIFGAIAGFIDAIAGGGGLITLPVLLGVLPTGTEAIGTNKIVGSLGLIGALIVYARAGHVHWGKSFLYALAVGIGSVCGSLLTPFVPNEAFRWVVVVLSPAVLWLVWKRDLWTQERPQTHKTSKTAVLGWGFLAGVYDGMWGPGGGTLMFLVLFLGARWPLMQSIACSKVANLFSASFSLVSFGLRGYVHWDVGLPMAIAFSIAAAVGAHYNTRTSARIVRPLLVVVTLLLVAKVLFEK